MAKQNPKYVKKIPKPGGGYYYIYPDQIKQQWDSFKQNARNTANKVKKSINETKKDIADNSGYTDRQFLKQQQAKVNRMRANMMLNNRGNMKVDKKTQNELHKEMGFLKLAEHNYYNNSPLGKAEKAGKKAGSVAKAAGKAATAKAADAIGLDERRDYKNSQKGGNIFKKAINKGRYNDTIAGKIERATKPIIDEIGLQTTSVKNYANAKRNPGKISSAVYEDLDGKKTYLDYAAKKSGKVGGSISKSKLGSTLGKGATKANTAASDYAYDTKNGAKALGSSLVKAAGAEKEVEYITKKAKESRKKAKKKVNKALKKFK